MRTSAQPREHRNSRKTGGRRRIVRCGRIAAANSNAYVFVDHDPLDLATSSVPELSVFLLRSHRDSGISLQCAACRLAPAANARTCVSAHQPRSDSQMRMKLLTLLAAALLLSPLPALAPDRPDGDADGHGHRRERSGPARRHRHGDRANRSSAASRTAVTDANGVYRFPALPPGVYTVTAELSGFKTVHAGGAASARADHHRRCETRSRRPSRDGRRSPAASPTVDVKSSAAQKNLDQEMLENIPFSSRFGPGAMLIAPGVNPNNYSAYGSGGARRTPT